MLRRRTDRQDAARKLGAALSTSNVIFIHRQRIIAFKLKILIYYSNVLISPSILILPSLASSLTDRDQQATKAYKLTHLWQLAL